MLMMRRKRLVAGIGMIVFVMTQTVLTGSAGARVDADAPPVIKFGAATVGLHEAPYFRLDEYARKYGFRVETVPLASFAAKGSALQRGDVDAALIGPTNLAQYAADGVANIKLVSGAWWGQQWLVVRKGSGINKWSDLKGKTIGAPPGSYAYIAWLNALNEHGLAGDVKLVNTTFDPATVKTAFQSGAYDGVVFFSPFPDSWVLEGRAEFPKTNFVQDSSLGSSTGYVGIGARLIQDRALAVNVVRAIVDMQHDMVTNRDKWSQIATQIAGVAPDVANFAVQRGCMAFPIEVNAIKKFGAVAPDYGVTKTDVSSSITRYIDLSYLKTVTGLPERRLISTPACAPDGQRSPTGVLGTDGSDTLAGTAAPDKLFGLAGNDSLKGLAGADILDGGTGNDRLDGGAGNDKLAGGAGNDVLLGGAGNDELSGGAGSDTLAGGAGLNRYTAGAGNDVIVARNGRKETVNCGSGRDTVTADRSDRLIGCETRK